VGELTQTFMLKEFVDVNFPGAGVKYVAEAIPSYSGGTEWVNLIGNYNEYRTLAMRCTAVPLFLNCNTNLGAATTTGLIVGSAVYKTPGAIPVYTTMLNLSYADSFRLDKYENKIVREARMAGTEEAQWQLAGSPGSQFGIVFLYDTRATEAPPNSAVGCIFIERLVQARNLVG